MYACSLNAEGAFDQITHVIFQKLGKVIGDEWWRCMYVWYTNITVNIKWNNEIGKLIHICKGI